MGRRSTISRDELLDAAERVIAEGGAAKLTLEAVAARAGVSKGGLQYAFRSKTALIQAMIQRYVDEGERDFAREKARLGGDPRRSLEAYVRANLGSEEVTTVHTALMAAVASDPGLLRQVDLHFSQTVDQLVAQTGLPRARVIAVTLASDALTILSVLGIRPLLKADREALIEELIALATPTDEAAPDRKRGK